MPTTTYKRLIKTSTNSRRIDSNNKATTDQSLQLLSLDDQSPNDCKIDQSKPRLQAWIPFSDSFLDSTDGYPSGSRIVSHQQVFLKTTITRTITLDKEVVVVVVVVVWVVVVVAGSGSGSGSGSSSCSY